MLSKAIHSLVRTGYHHCWVVGDVATKTPVGVLSLTDIFKILPTMVRLLYSFISCLGFRVHGETLVFLHFLFGV
jgi:hypothetical protein